MSLGWELGDAGRRERASRLCEGTSGLIFLLGEETKDAALQGQRGVGEARVMGAQTLRKQSCNSRGLPAPENVAGKDLDHWFFLAHLRIT